jgi:hypothetical protein
MADHLEPQKVVQRAAPTDVLMVDMSVVMWVEQWVAGMAVWKAD